MSPSKRCPTGVRSRPPASPGGPSAPRLCPQVLSWAQQQGERLQVQRASLAAEREEVAQLVDWITAAEEALSLRDQEPLPEEAEQLEELNAQHTVRDPVPCSPPCRGPCRGPHTLTGPGRGLDPTEDFRVPLVKAVSAPRVRSTAPFAA